MNTTQEYVRKNLVLAGYFALYPHPSLVDPTYLEDGSSLDAWAERFLYYTPPEKIELRA